MDPRRALRFLSLALVVPLADCATMGGLRQEPLAAGATHLFPAPLGPVVDAARQAMVGAGIDIREQVQPSPDIWILLGAKGMSLWSYGELVRVVARQTDSAQTSVYVITQRRLATNVTASEDRSTTLFDRMAATLGLSGTFTPEGTVTLLAGTRVRLTWREQGRTLAGELRALRGDTLVVYDPVRSHEVTPLVGELRSLEVASGRRTAARAGAMVGGVLGVVAGVALASGTSQDNAFFDNGPFLIGMGVASAGAVLGALVGSGMVTERWEPLPLERLRVALARQPGP